MIVPQEVAFDLDKLQKTLANILGRLGCPGCTSRFEIRFIQQLDFVVNPKNLAVEQMAGMERG